LLICDWLTDTVDRQHVAGPIDNRNRRVEIIVIKSGGQ